MCQSGAAERSTHQSVIQIGEPLLGLVPIHVLLRSLRAPLALPARSRDQLCFQPSLFVFLHSLLGSDLLCNLATRLRIVFVISARLDWIGGSAVFPPRVVKKKDGLVRKRGRGGQD